MFLFYRVRAAAESAGRPVGRLRRIALAAVTALVLLVAVPLTIGTLAVAQDEQLAADAHPVAEEWARDGDWHIESVAARNGVVMVDALGLPPELDPTDLRTSLDRRDLRADDVELHLVGGLTRLCPAGRARCEVTWPRGG
ncbi:hypothetical protein OHB54_42260 [Streptomyces sp. NBC_01007]|nr:hypothetical protein OHB54_42260 [Streptomyces sp. NBC_01007]